MNKWFLCSVDGISERQKFQNAWMNSAGAGHGLQNRGGLAAQVFDSPFCALFQTGE